MRKFLALVAIAALAVTLPMTATAAPQPHPETVGQFARLPFKQRRQFAIRFMTTHGVDPCDGGKSPLTREEARNIASEVAQDVRPGRDAADGSYVRAGTPIGFGIRHLLANIGC